MATVKKAAATKKKSAGAQKKTDDGAALNVLFVAGEAAPFAQTGGLGEVAGSLPAAVNALNGRVKVSVILPLYSCVKNEYRKDFKFLGNLNVPLAWRCQYAGLYKYDYCGVTYYFVDNEYYFKRTQVFGCYDDGERFAFFSRAVLELLPLMDDKPNILHCNDWHTALVPVYYHMCYRSDPRLRDLRTLFTIHNIEYQGKYSGLIVEDVFGLPRDIEQSISYGGCVNLMYAGMCYSDRVSTVSPTYAKELEDSYFACGLEKAVRGIKYKFSGIINGINVSVYDPSSNPSLFAHYSAADTSGKAVNKLGLQKMLNLPEKPDVPLLIVVSRLAGHKGADILRGAMTNIMSRDVQFVILGTGEQEYESFFNTMQQEYHAKMRLVAAFNPDMAQKMFGAGDIFLMPSRSEPCGLGQIMAMRYGAVPVVRRCGGLKDTVSDGVNGFSFDDYSEKTLEETIIRALEAFGDEKRWAALMSAGMNADYSWGASGVKYIQLYEETVK